MLDVSDLDQGDAPALAHAILTYVKGQPRGGTIHAVDGSTTPLPALGLAEFAPLGDGWVVDMVDPDKGDEAVFLLAADGSHGKSYPAEGGLAVSPGGNVVAWTAPDGTVRTAHAETDEVLTMPRVARGRGSFRTVGVTGDDCQQGRSTDDGCTVVVNSGGKVWLTTSHGIVDSLPRMIAATTSQGDLLGAMVSVDESEPGSCSRMLRGWSRTLWKTCDNTLDALSPDGAHLVGLPAYLDGFGPNALDLLSMVDGSAVQSWTGDEDSATYFDQVWEDDQHVLVRTFQDRQWAVVRIGLDGSMEYAVAPAAGDSFESPFILQTR